jgi:hypothetical protein
MGKLGDLLRQLVGDPGVCCGVAGQLGGEVSQVGGGRNL